MLLCSPCFINTMKHFYLFSFVAFSLTCRLFRYSFRLPPRLDLHVRPVLGDREVTFTHITEWIEKKLQCEFQVSPPPLRKLSSLNFPHQTCYLLDCTTTESVGHAQHGRPLSAADVIRSGEPTRSAPVLSPFPIPAVFGGVPGLPVRVALCFVDILRPAWC